MQVYLVGGAVRDELLGLTAGERDWVVTGATPAELEAQGFRAVGREFPVFIHPESGEEYALARLERKVAPGYRGFQTEFSPQVTLEEDLQRRDLTVNAMARDDGGRIVDPYGGQRDLAARQLRHVSPAFSEDPVRILRVARFAARFGFAIAPETLELMRSMVAAGEADALVPERVWQELARGLMEPAPSRMIAVLRECDALARVLPELDGILSDPRLPARLAARIDRAAHRGYSLPVRFALLLLDMPLEKAAALAQRVNAPTDCRDLARIAILERDLLASGGQIDAEAALQILERADAFRRPERLERLLEVAECDALAESPAQFAPRAALAAALQAARAVDAAGVARENPADVADAIRRARLVAIAGLQAPSGN